MGDFDVIIGGGSPIMAFIALKCAVDFDLKVAVLDAAPQLGGSWTPQTRFGHEIDNGPHLLYNFNSDIRPLLNELSRLADVRFRPMVPQPHSNHRLHRSIMEYSFGVTPGSRLTKLGRAGMAVARKIVPGVSAPLYYGPEGGLSELATAAATALKKHGVSVYTGSGITRVHEASSQVQVESAAGVFTARHFLGTARILPALEPELFRADGALNRIVYAQAYIKLRGGPPLFSYFRPFNDPLFFLAADLSASANPTLPAGERILSINLQAGADHTKIGADRIVQFLLDNGLISRSDRIEAVEWEIIENPEITLSLVQDRNRRHAAAHFVHCNNKVRALSEYLLEDRLARILDMALA